MIWSEKVRCSCFNINIVVACQPECRFYAAVGWARSRSDCDVGHDIGQGSADYYQRASARHFCPSGPVHRRSYACCQQWQHWLRLPVGIQTFNWRPHVWFSVSVLQQPRRGAFCYWICENCKVLLFWKLLMLSTKAMINNLFAIIWFMLYYIVRKCITVLQMMQTMMIDYYNAIRSEFQ